MCEGSNARGYVSCVRAKAAEEEVVRLIACLRTIADPSTDDLERVKDYVRTMVNRSPGQTWR